MVMDLFSEKPKIFTVSELRNTLNNIIESQFAGHILLRGVVSSQPKQYPQFVFFDIKDENKNQFFTVFAMKSNFLKAESKLRALGVVDKLTQDVPIMLIAKVKISAQKQISLRLVMEDIVPDYTKSVLKDQKDLTLERLQKENLLDLQKQLVLPKLIKKIAIITSDQGTSLKDIRSAIGIAQKYIDIVFVSSRVEGDSAIAGVIDAVERLNDKRLGIDLILLARGGGSAVDLSVFNDYELCKAVTKSLVPVVAAIGHDKDELAVEFASYLRPSPATPSGAGAFVKKIILDNFIEFKREFSNIFNLIESSFDVNILKIRELLINIIRVSEHKISTELERIKNILESIKIGVKSIFENEERYLNLLVETVKAYDHKKVLKRGYAVVWSGDKIIKTASNSKDIMEIEFFDDKIKVERKK